MITDLRDRRRRQTAAEIQLAALRLSLKLGYGAVTTEAIAAEAGISSRTFFNYYPNKQAAVLGQPPQLQNMCARWIVASDQPLLDDLARLMGQMLAQKDMDRQVVRMIGQVWATTPELMAVFRNSMDNIALTIGGLLEERFGPGRQMEAMLIAELSTHALSHSVRAWAEDETMPTEGIQTLIRRQLGQVARLLA